MALHPSSLVYVHPSREGIPMEASAWTISLAVAAVVAVGAMFASVLGVVYLRW